MLTFDLYTHTLVAEVTISALVSHGAGHNSFKSVVLQCAKICSASSHGRLQDLGRAVQFI